MKILSSSPYAPFNSKEWNSLGIKNDKFVDYSVKVQKEYFNSFAVQKIKKTKVFPKKKEIHKQMQLLFA